MLLTVYVPAGEDVVGIEPGSAIVGSPVGDRVRGRHPQSRLLPRLQQSLASRRWSARVERSGLPDRCPPDGAASRLQGGTYDPDSHKLEVTDASALEAWVALWR
jgi:hypothetical protein